MIVELEVVGIAAIVGLFTGLCFIWIESRGASKYPESAGCTCIE